jgi:hypothetical protein
MPAGRSRLLACLVALACAAPSARAVDGEWALSVGPTYRFISDERVGSHHGLGGAFGFHFGLDDFWQIGATLDAGGFIARNEAQALDDNVGLWGSARLDVRWIVDVLTWVPFVELSAGLAVRGREPAATGGATSSEFRWSPARLDLVTLLSLGLDWRPARSWSIGGRVGGGALLTDLARGGILTRLELVGVYHFD